MSEQPIPKEPKKELVNIACRATPECPGNKAEKQVINPRSAGATLIRFICQTCKKTFHVPMGTTLDI